ncbi:MAG: hypothetical protein ACYDFS_00370 [Vulcanimicrobiaceae bacterium]
MSVERVLDKLEAYVREGTWLPAGYRILSEERLVELLEKVRSCLPEEVSRARVIAKDQDRVIRVAQEKADAIITEASSKHEELLDDHEIVKRARATAEAVLRDAEERAKRVREGADTYAGQVLTELEGRLGAALGSIRKGREALERSRSSPVAPAAQPLADAAARSKRAAFDHRAADEAPALKSVEV